MNEMINDIEENATLIDPAYRWLLDPIHAAYFEVAASPFFDWLKQISRPIEFLPAATQIFFHSNTFPKAMGLMLSMMPVAQWGGYKLLSDHVYEEAEHSLWLLDWMIAHNLITDKEQIFEYLPTLETNNCINIGYQIAMERDLTAWIACINCAVEYCAYNFFKAVAPQMHACSAGHRYFDTHVAADASHSVMGLDYLESMITSEEQREVLVKKAMDAVSLWGAMVNSWIEEPFSIKFDLKGGAK